MKTRKLLLVAALASVGVLASCTAKSPAASSSEAPATSAPTSEAEQVASGIKKALVNCYQVPLKIDGDAIAIDDSKKQASAANIATNKKSDTIVLSKVELGNLYGMSALPNTTEWNVQAKAFETYVEGKEFSALSQNYKTHYNPTGTVEVTGCTISVGDYVSAFQEAGTLAKDVTLAAGTYKVASGSLVKYDAAKSQVEVEEAAYIVDSTNKIVAVYFDVVQAPLAINGTAIALDATKGAVKDAGTKNCETKKELKERYGMSALPNTTEWYVQAKAFEDYCVGKTVAELNQNYKTHYNPTGAVEITGCTISVGDLVKAVEGVCREESVTVQAGTYKLGLGTIISTVGEDNVLTVTNGAVLSK